MEPIIKIRSPSKNYHREENELGALENISLRVVDGDYLTILGPSSSGKSTLVNVTGCTDCFQEEEYCLAGRTVGQLNDVQFIKLRNERIGFIFQGYHLIQEYSALLNTMTPLLIRGIPRKHTEELSMEKLNIPGTSDRVGHKPNGLSDGQQQRIAIARALMGTPELLLTGEPIDTLDRATGQEVLKLFGELNPMGNTIMMITRDLSVAQHTEWIVHIINGESCEDGQEEQAGEKELPVKAPVQEGE